MADSNHRPTPLHIEDFAPYPGQYHFQSKGTLTSYRKGGLDVLLGAFLNTPTPPTAPLRGSEANVVGRFRSFEKLFLAKLTNEEAASPAKSTTLSKKQTSTQTAVGSRALLATVSLAGVETEASSIPTPNPLPNLLSDDFAYGAIRSQIFEEAIDEQFKELAEYLELTS